jgi:hypothetical protein
MDLLAQIKQKLTSRENWRGATGIESVVMHIEIAERHHFRAKTERDEHLYTDVIYRTNHAYEGVLKEAYVLLTGNPAGTRTPFEIEEYFLTSSVLRSRVVDLLKNYRQNWRNPSTHDYQLLFSEQESFLAIVTVSAFVSILLDQMLERLAFIEKTAALENATRPAKDAIDGFASMSPIDKTFRILLSYIDHYIKNFESMSDVDRLVATAQLAAFIQTVAPETVVQQGLRVESEDGQVVFDLMLTVDETPVAVEIRDSRTLSADDIRFESEAAIEQLATHLRISRLQNGVLFHLPSSPDRVALAVTASSAWPTDVNLRIVYGADPDEVSVFDADEVPVSLVDEEP